QEVVASGANLNTQPPTINVGGLQATVLEATADAVKFRVPADLPSLEGKAFPVIVRVGPEAARPAELVMGHLPLLREASPASAAPGARVKLKGRGFAT